MKILISYLMFTLLLISACTKKESAEKQTAEKSQVNSKEITYMVDTTTMKGYMAYPKDTGEKVPGILVVHEWWGLNAYARKRADMLAKLGYVALALDMYGNGKQAEHPKDAQKFAMSVMGNFATAKARFTKALEVLKADPRVDPEKTAAIGYCFGGSVVLSMANAGVDLDAVAAFHAGLQLPVQPEKGRVKAKILVCNGGADPFIPAEQVAKFKASLDSAGADYRYISYPGVKHSFTNPNSTELGKKFNLPMAYDKHADEQSWDELKKFLASTF